MNRTNAAPRLTIAIPTLNRCLLVGRAIESALAQTSQDIEIIVSNNGSTDDTQKVLESYSNMPRLRILHRKQTIPANEHGNILLEQARGEFFLGLSDDDWLEPNMVARVLQLYDQQPDISFIWTGCWMHYAEVTVPALTGPIREAGETFLCAFLAGSRNVCWCACVTRTADLKRLGPLPSGVICGDMYYWTKLAAEGDVACIEEPLCHYICYRDGGDGMAGGASVKAWMEENSVVVREILAICRSKTLGKNSSDTLERNAVSFLARTVANQFAWNALRGLNRGSLWKLLLPSFPILKRGTARNWLTVMAALFAPRLLLRHRVISIAARRSLATRTKDLSDRS